MTNLVIGGSGLVGYEFYRQKKDNYKFTYKSQKINSFIELDATCFEETKKLINKLSPEIVIVTAAMPDVNKCEIEKELAFKTNVGIIENIIKCLSKKSKIVFFSSDYVFDGNSGPYSEKDKTNPINYYGELKVSCERKIINSGIKHLIIRTTGIFGWEMARKNFFYRVFDTLSSGKELFVPNDQFGNPTYVKDLVSTIEKMLNQDCEGIYNVVGEEWIARDNFARNIAKSFGLNDTLIIGKPTKYFKNIAPRPLKAGLRSDKIRKLGISIKSMDQAFEDMKNRKSIDDRYT
ncbi:MAG: NAD(P)-dependent oxidoreductase [Candidatus Aenigmarchaeota archaeon]|nr:NAD(P)-dependent oxidoreductase [Candidatus Aenigmarchaeota archaeon]